MSEAMYYLVQCFGLVQAKSLLSKRSATAYPQGRWWSGYVVALHESSRSKYTTSREAMSLTRQEP